jgi:hypothetical protein
MLAQNFLTAVDLGISDEDYAWLVQWRWQYKVSARKYLRTSGIGRGVYAKRTAQINGRKTTLLLSHVILTVRMGLERPGDDFDADHLDGNSLNDQRSNLQWLHRSPNRACCVRQYREAA